jgi:formiminoglutamase/agmatinase
MDHFDGFDYLLRPRLESEYRFGFIGVAHDAATTLGNPGARFAPAALRQALKGIFDWRLNNHRLADIETGVIDLSNVEVVDFGDVALSYHEADLTVEETCRQVSKVLDAGCFPLVVGGDHGVTFPAVKALHASTREPIGLIQLDAHCDLMNFSQRQGRYSGSSGMRRCLELDRLSGGNLVQIGLRGYTSVEQYQMGDELGLRRITAADFNEQGPVRSAERALAWAGEGTGAIYLSVDMDVVDPGEAPGTGWPEPGGLNGQQLIDFVRLVSPHISAMDITELNPVFDTQARTTAVLAARLLLDCITSRVINQTQTGN